MTKMLTKHGNSLAVILDKPLLDLLSITENTPLEITTDGRGFYIAPADSSRKKKFEQAKADTFAKYSKTLKRLAE